MSEREMKPTARLRWARRIGDEQSGLTQVMVLQQYWTPVVEYAFDEHKAELWGEWRDVPIEDI